MNANPFNPEALLIARESRGRTQADVSEATGINQGILSKVENGVRPLADDQVTKVADFLRYPVQFFYEPGPLREGKSGCLYHRKRKTLPVKLLDRLDAQMAVRLVNTRHMINGLDIVGARWFHTLDPDEFDGPENVARALRTAWRVAPGPIPNLVALIESAGGIIVTAPFQTLKLFGMSQWTTRDHPLFFLNADTSVEERRWTIAHELGHLTMHGTPTSEDLEAQADAFAGEFLAPIGMVKPELRALSFGQLPALKMRWRLSMKALIKRAEVTAAVSRTEAVRLYKQYSARRWNNAEPYPLSPEPPTLIREAARVHLRDHGYTVAELADAVRLSTEELEADLLGGDSPPPALSLVR